jgi:hypothetical protein
MELGAAWISEITTSACNGATQHRVAMQVYFMREEGNIGDEEEG